MTQRLALTLACAAVLAGCATSNPLITWDRSDRVPPGSTDPMALAKARAGALRSALEAKRSEQVGGTADLNNALLGLGVLTTGLALGKVHRDAFTFTAGLAGASVLFGQQNLPKPRAALYESGIKAVNCALRAVGPIDMGGDQRDRFVADSAELAKAQSELRTARATARARLDDAITQNLSGEKASAAEGRLNALAVISAQAVASQGEVADLLWRLQAAANELTHVVESIGAQVNELTAGTVGDPANVPTLLSGLAAIAGRYAPGLGVDARITALSAPPKSPGDGSGQSGLRGLKDPSNPKLDDEALAMKSLYTALAQAERRADAVDALQRPLALRLTAFKGFAAADALKTCGVADLALQLVLSATELSFKPGVKQGQSVLLSGGVKPYIARLRETEGGGVEVKSPVPGDSNVEINVAASATGPRVLHVDLMDNANPRQLKTVVVTIQAATAKTPAVTEPPPSDGNGESGLLKGSAVAALASAFNQLRLAQRAGGTVGGVQVDDEAGRNAYRIAAIRPPAAGQPLLLTLDCTPASPAAKDAAASVTTALLRQLVAPNANGKRFMTTDQLPDSAPSSIALKSKTGQHCLAQP